MFCKDTYEPGGYLWGKWLETREDKNHTDVQTFFFKKHTSNRDNLEMGFFFFSFHYTSLGVINVILKFFWKSFSSFSFFKILSPLFMGLCLYKTQSSVGGQGEMCIFKL